MAARSPDTATRRSPDPSPPSDHLIARPGGRAAALRLDGVVAAFLADGRARGLSPRTLECYAAAIASYRTALAVPPAGQRLGDLALEPARAWTADLADGRRPATVANRVRSLRVFGRWLVAEGYLRADPLARLARPRVPRVAIAPFTDAQVALLLAAARPEVAIVLETLLDTGLRIGEALDVRFGDVAGGLIHVRGKGGHERGVPYGRRLEADLRRYVGSVRPRAELTPEGHLFLSTAGRPMTRELVYQAMRRIGARADFGRTRVSPHTCRHTFALAFLRNGGNVLALQRILGHSDLAMVRRYVELAEVDLVAAQASASPLDRWARSSGWRRRD